MRRKGESVYLTGLDRLTHGGGVPNAYISSLVCILHACGQKRDYGVMLGGSGLAFRVAIDPARGPDPHVWAMDEGCVSAAWRYAGYDRIRISRRGDGARALKTFLAAAREQIEDGRPLIANDVVCEGLFGVVAGVAGDSLLCRVLGDEGNGYQREPCSSRVMETLGEPLDGVDERQWLREGLARGVQFWGEGRRDSAMLLGAEAYRSWADWLRDDASRCELDQDELARSMRGNHLAFQWLVDARLCLPSFLRYAAATLGIGEPGRSALNEAASVYARLGGKLKPGIALTEPGEGGWSPGAREKQARLLERCLEFEVSAAAAVRSALG